MTAAELEHRIDCLEAEEVGRTTATGCLLAGRVDVEDGGIVGSGAGAVAVGWASEDFFRSPKRDGIKAEMDSLLNNSVSMANFCAAGYCEEHAGDVLKKSDGSDASGNKAAESLCDSKSGRIIRPDWFELLLLLLPALLLLADGNVDDVAVSLGSIHPPARLNRSAGPLCG